MIPGYGISDARTFLLLAALILLIPLLGLAIYRIGNATLARVLAWALVFCGVTLTIQLSFTQPAGSRMIYIITALLWSMKCVVATEAKRTDLVSLSTTQYLSFSMLWFGMRPSPFRHLPSRPLPEVRHYLNKATIRIGLGLALFFTAYVIWHLNDASGSVPRSWPGSRDLVPYQKPGLSASTASFSRTVGATLFLLPALSLLVHFGLFNVLTAFWRNLGVPCTSLFNTPLISTSLSEFWGRRWNLAFSEMTALAIFRPLRSYLGKGIATATAFLFSGLLHELAISVPVNSGYGLPMLYFTLHGFAMFVEQWLKARGNKLLQETWPGRLWTACWIFLPLPLLFHIRFLEGCVWPLIDWTL